MKRERMLQVALGLLGLFYVGLIYPPKAAAFGRSLMDGRQTLPYLFKSNSPEIPFATY
jgi:hypothetical protein